MVHDPYPGELGGDGPLLAVPEVGEGNVFLVDRCQIPFRVGTGPGGVAAGGLVPVADVGDALARRGVVEVRLRADRGADAAEAPQLEEGLGPGGGGVVLLEDGPGVRELAVVVGVDVAYRAVPSSWETPMKQLVDIGGWSCVGRSE